MSENIITAEEMAAATDESMPVSPAKFLPYRKLVNALHGIDDHFERIIETLDRIAAQFRAIEATADTGISELGALGAEYAVSHCNQFQALRDETADLVHSAKATVPRMRFDTSLSGCPDDVPDENDLQRESAARVPPEEDPQ